MNIKCRVEWEHTDGKRVKYLERYFYVPSWILNGMRIGSERWGGIGTVTYVTTNLDDCSQNAYVDKYTHSSANEMDECVESLIEDGWEVESEDEYD